MPVTMYHNPRCNTSRRTLALLREKGVEPQIVEYLKTPPSAVELKRILGWLKMPASSRAGQHHLADLTLAHLRQLADVAAGLSDVVRRHGFVGLPRAREGLYRLASSR